MQTRNSSRCINNAFKTKTAADGNMSQFPRPLRAFMSVGARSRLHSARDMKGASTWLHQERALHPFGHGTRLGINSRSREICCSKKKTLRGTCKGKRNKTLDFWASFRVASLHSFLVPDAVERIFLLQRVFCEF